MLNEEPRELLAKRIQTEIWLCDLVIKNELQCRRTNPANKRNHIACELAARQAFVTAAKYSGIEESEFVLRDWNSRLLRQVQEEASVPQSRRIQALKTNI